MYLEHGFSLRSVSLYLASSFNDSVWYRSFVDKHNSSYSLRLKLVDGSISRCRGRHLISNKYHTAYPPQKTHHQRFYTPWTFIWETVFVAWWRRRTLGIFVNTGSGDGLLLVSNKPVMTYHQRGPRRFTSEQWWYQYWRYPSPSYVWNLHIQNHSHIFRGTIS